MRALVLASCLAFAAASTTAQEKPGSPTQPQNLSIPATVDPTTVKLPEQSPDYLSEAAGWKLVNEKEGNLPVRASSKEGLWSLTVNFRGRLRVYQNDTLGLEVYEVALKTGKDRFTDATLAWATRDGASIRFALRLNGQWVPAKNVLGKDDETTIENNVILYADKLDDATRTIVLKAKLETADGLKETEFKLE